ncbi:MAG: peroxiredoxin [Bacteroidetes bacterium]|nr:peroxiredoxin [Bacteroidota bacterium]
MTLQIGSAAPDFTLPDSEKNLIELSSFRGRNVVLLFFPFAYTGVCTTELCGVRDTLHDYTSLNAEVLAISVDSPFTLKQWKTEQGFNFTMLSDFNKEASTAYGSLYETFSVGLKGVSKRSAFVIDREGVIRYAEVLDNAGEIPNLDAVKATLSSLA